MPLCLRNCHTTRKCCIFSQKSMYSLNDSAVNSTPYSIHSECQNCVVVVHYDVVVKSRGHGNSQMNDQLAHFAGIYSHSYTLHTLRSVGWKFSNGFCKLNLIKLCACIYVVMSVYESELSIEICMQRRDYSQKRRTKRKKRKLIINWPSHWIILLCPMMWAKEREREKWRECECECVVNRK